LKGPKLYTVELNHVDYYDCEISERIWLHILRSPPVVVDYHPSSSNKNPESTSVHDMEEDGTTRSCHYSPCITGEEFSTKTMKPSKL